MNIRSMVANKIQRKRISRNFVSHSEKLPEITVLQQSSSESHYSSNKLSMARETIKLFVSSWNVGGVSPPDKLDLEELLDNDESTSDIYVFGFQEIVPLRAGNILAPENITVSMKWNSLIKAALNKKVITERRLQQSAQVGETKTTYHHSSTSIDSSASNFKCLISKQMVGIYITVWVRTELHSSVSNPSFSCVGCGILGRLGNKGSVSIRFNLHGTSFCFICSHLASGGKEGDERQRNIDASQILARTTFPAEFQQDLPRKILDHDKVIWIGDLNYRIYLPEATTRLLVQNKLWDILLEHDQLKAELTKSRVFEGWNEEEIEFAPTYKYNEDSDDYYGSNDIMKVKTKRAPAWCDRIIWFGQGLSQIEYNRVESRLSDHRPVRATFFAYGEASRPTTSVPDRNLSDRYIDLPDHLTSRFRD